MLIRLIYFLDIILCGNEYVIEHDTFTIAVDKPIEEIDEIHDLLAKGIHISLYESNKFCKLHKFFNDFSDNSFIIWDRYFPKTYLYDIKISLESSDTSFTKELEFLSNDCKVMFSFKIAYNNSQLVISEFYDANKARMDVKKQNDLYCDFILISQGTNIEYIKNSLEYLKKAEMLMEFFEENESFFDDFSKLPKIFFGTENFSILVETKIFELQLDVISILNTLVKPLLPILMPSSRRLEKYEPFDFYKKRIGDIIEKISDITKLEKYEIEQGNMTNKNEQLNLLIEREKDFSETAINNLSKLEDFYYKFTGHIESFDTLVKNKVEKGIQNTEVILEYDTRKFDTFLKLFSPLLLKYCEIMHDFNNIEFYAQYFYIFLENGFYCDFHLDLIVATELKKYLLDYSKDKTDFIIFSQSDYFKNKLASEIGKILSFITLDLEKRDINIINGIRASISVDDLKYFNRVEEFQKEWEAVICQYGDVKNVSFVEILENIVPETVIKDDYLEQKNVDKKTSEQKAGINNNKSYSPLLYVSLSVVFVGLVVIIIYYIYNKQKK